MTEIIQPIHSDGLDYEDIISRIRGIYNSCSPIEQRQLLKILEELSDKGYSETLEKIYLVDFKEVPVSIDRFLCDPEYLGESNDCGNQIYPGWWDAYHSVFDTQTDKYEIILSGATRIGKTSTAVSMMAYMTYLIMCYRNPQRYFKHKDTMIPVIAFANLTKDLAKGVAFQEFCNTIKLSPWFNKHGKFSTMAKVPLYTPENNGAQFVVSSDSSHILGMATWAILMDECNFSRAGIKDITKSKEHMKNLYDTANTRITGSYTLRDSSGVARIFGKMFTCSSKNTDSDYLSEHIEKQLNSGNTHMYLFDKPQWEVLPEDRYSKETFYITVGDRYKRGFIIPDENSDEAHLQEYRNEGYQVLAVPESYKPRFRADYDISLRDIAGISVVGAMGFITQEMITPNVSETRKNPFFMDYYEIGVQDQNTIEQYFHAEVVSPELKRLPMYVHIDFAEVSDHIGIAGVVRDGDKVVEDNLTGKKITMPFLKEIFQVAIGAPRGDRMSFQKVINFIVWLKKNGFNVVLVSTDQYQSSYVRENLTQQGFPTEKVSVDKSEDPYIGLRNILQDQRIELIKHDLQEVELIHLQRVNGVINHPPQSACFTEDTKIQLVDGRILTIAELLVEQQYKTNWVYTINETTGLIEPKPIIDVFQTKLTKDLVKVTLDNDEVIYCTPDHRFMVRDGSYETAKNLKAGDSLMPLYTKVADKGLQGYRLYYEPMTDDWHYEHRSFCLEPKLNTDERTVVHHCNYNKLDNTPTNLKRVTVSKHKQIHNHHTIDYSKMARSLSRWHTNNKDTEQYKTSKQKGIINLIIRNHYVKTGEMLSISDATIIRNKQIVRNQMFNLRVRDIELLFNVKWGSVSGRTHNILGARLSALIHNTERQYGVNWVELSDNEKIKFFNEFERLKKKHHFDAFSFIVKQEVSKALNKLLSKPRRITTIPIFTQENLRISWIEYIFGGSWCDLSKGEKCRVTRRFNRFLESGEFVPLNQDITYTPKSHHIIKSLSLFGTEQDIKMKNIEEYCGICMKDVPSKQRSGYGKIYSNFCKGKISKDEQLRRRISDIERVYGVSWCDLDTAGKSKYSLMYHNLMNPDDKYRHYNSVAKAISKYSWYTNGTENKYIANDSLVPDGYYKGRTLKNHKVGHVQQQQVMLAALSQFLRFLHLQRQINHQRVGGRAAAEVLAGLVRESVFLLFLSRRPEV